MFPTSRLVEGLVLVAADHHRLSAWFIWKSTPEVKWHVRITEFYRSVCRLFHTDLHQWSQGPEAWCQCGLTVVQYSVRSEEGNYCVRSFYPRVCVSSDGITPADGSVSPDFFSDLQPQNGDLHHAGWVNIRQKHELSYSRYKLTRVNEKSNKKKASKQQIICPVLPA